MLFWGEYVMTGVKQPSYELESYAEEERARRQEKPRPDTMKLHPGFSHTGERNNSYFVQAIIILCFLTYF